MTTLGLNISPYKIPGQFFRTKYHKSAVDFHRNQASVAPGKKIQFGRKFGGFSETFQDFKDQGEPHINKNAGNLVK